MFWLLKVIFGIYDSFWLVVIRCFWGVDNCGWDVDYDILDIESMVWFVDNDVYSLMVWLDDCFEW